MRLNSILYKADEVAAPTLLVAHGLLGSARNWGALAKRLARGRPVVAVDMRNHGESPWSAVMDYPAMAADLAEAIEAETIGAGAGAGGRADVLGHSMGGKAAMALALTAPGRVGRLIVADIAPRRYGHSYDAVFAAMAGLDLSRVGRRSEADAALRDAIPDLAMRAFVLTNLDVSAAGARWRPNVETLALSMADILSWPERWPHAAFDGPALFLSGGRSDYVAEADRPAILRLFPNARFEAIPDAGHWLHAERPEAFLAAVERFLG
jgi:pimeloyl-ACP methyl ester carboxylesterase